MVVREREKVNVSRRLGTCMTERILVVPFIEEWNPKIR